MSGRGVFRMALSCRGRSRGKGGDGMVNCGLSAELDVLSTCMRLLGEMTASSALTLALSGDGRYQENCETCGFRLGAQSMTR